jgi:aspartyl-tRNA(Asn)/glutamyl-tRNA(Gln) amidotransferase subunit B
MEEDVAKLTHINSNGNSYSILDINRSGTPLMEIVTEPDLGSSDEVIEYIESLQKIIRYIKVGSANMEEGSFRCDANISVKEEREEKLGTKVEIKNMNRISAVAEAVDYEIKRQIHDIENNIKIIQETRGWSEERKKTIPQRTKEESNDYRYFPEPDIPPLTIKSSWIDQIRNKLPVLPQKRKENYIKNYQLNDYDASLLTNDINFSDFFDKTINFLPKKIQNNETIKYLANLMNGEFNRLLNNNSSMEFNKIKFTEKDLAELIMIYKSSCKYKSYKINNKILKNVFEQMWHTGENPEKIIKDNNLSIVTDTDELESTIYNIIESNPKAVEDFLSGKEQSKKFLLGQVMKATKGQADPSVSNSLINKILDKKK